MEIHKTQTSLALSAVEAELIVTCEAKNSVMWMQEVLKDVRATVSGATPVTLHHRYQPPAGVLDNMPVEPPLIVHDDNQGAIKNSTTDSNTRRSKHVDTNYHHIENKTTVKAGTLEYTPTADMRADILTKPLSKI
jgi:hypothetical protein